MKNLKEMRAEIVSVFNEYRDSGTKEWNFEVASQDLQYQVGTLAKRILQLKGYRHKEGLNEEEIRANISDELADIMAEVLYISYGLNIDLDLAWDKMISSDRNKIKERSLNGI